ncbi:MAG: homoserine O-acetyltransferase [Rhodothermales bacterium]
MYMVETYTIPTHELERGGTLQQAPVAFETWGMLNAEGSNAILVCHALTGDTHIDEWWSGLFGPGRVLDPTTHFIVACNVLGSPYGSVSPLSVDPSTGQPYGPRFPDLTIRDTVAAQKQVLEHLGVQRLELAIGGSMGGMQVLEWAFYGKFVHALAVMAVGGRHSPWCIGWSEAQRHAIFADPKWKGGEYDSTDPPRAGLSAARMMAMIAYRSSLEFEARFGREAQPERDDLFAVQSYLQYQGQKLVDRFDANCYVALTRQMDTHDVARGRGAYPDVLAQIEQPTFILGIDTDVLYPLHEQRELATHIPNSHLHVVESLYGHDGFLIEQSNINDALLQWQQPFLTASTSTVAA